MTTVNNNNKSTISNTLIILTKKTEQIHKPEFIQEVNDWVNNVIKLKRLINPMNSLDLIYAADFGDTKNVEKVLKFRKIQIHILDCRFNIPQVRSCIEKLMGTNVVSLTDRDYMQKLQERILEDYEDQMNKRIKIREESEMERVKNLVLTGKIPLDQAPPEMARHPVMLIEKYCNKLIAARRAKIKIYKVKIPTYLYWDDTPDPPSGLSIESGHVFRQQGEKLCHPVERHLEASEEEDVQSEYMMLDEDYDKIKYEDLLVKRLMECETVEEMYIVADEIIGVLKTIDDSTRIAPDNVSDNLAAAV